MWSASLLPRRRISAAFILHLLLRLLHRSQRLSPPAIRHPGHSGPGADRVGPDSEQLVDGTATRWDADHIYGRLRDTARLQGVTQRCRTEQSADGLEPRPGSLVESSSLVRWVPPTGFDADGNRADQRVLNGQLVVEHRMCLEGER